MHASHRRFSKVDNPRLRWGGWIDGDICKAMYYYMHGCSVFFKVPR
jgi:hypothetical protein